ncbi:PspA [Myxococcus qinghaiensis]|uniref:PspA n=1 Tax=Myxococcus qinghaiensis TaxID=2906758 RepID=UPI0020A80A47|nr:PspA [Myxococcus qinghaiensis]MCP3167394.1 PspA [Myxococcus qinghaiensis]
MQNDMKSTIQAAVADAVEKATGRQLELLGRQLELLEKVVQFLGIEPGPTRVASGPKRASVPSPAPKRPSSVPVRKWVKPEAAPKPTRTKAAPQARRGRPRAAGRATTVAAPNSSPSPATSVAYEVGQEVRYKQGRGSFSAKVKSIDAKAKTVTVERVSDNKQVVRPFDKVTPA